MRFARRSYRADIGEDASAVAALDAIETHYARHDVGVEITGLNSQSHELHTTLTGQTAGAR